MKRSGLLFIAAVVLAWANPVYAQNNVDEQQGLKPYDAWHGGDLDTVSLSTGALALHIPLVSYPQRGSLDLSFSVVYSSKVWTVVATCVNNTTGGQTCTRKWEPLPIGGSTALKTDTNYNWPVTGAYAVSSVDYVLQRVINLDPPSNYSLISPDGNVHVLSDGGYPMRTFDATGFVETDINTVISRNGTRFYYPGTSGSATQQPATITDANGNQITMGSSGWTDTMGRVIPGSGGGKFVTPGVSTSDLSSCPSGTTSARVWTVPSVAPANGGVTGTRTFNFCYSLFNIFTNFGTGATEYSPTNTSLLSAVVLPDGTMWTLSYDNYGDVTRLGFPTGGSISYTYSTGPTTVNGASMWVRSRTVNANDGTGDHTWNYGYAHQSGCSFITTVTSPDGNDTVHCIANPVAGSDGSSLFDVQVKQYQGAASGGVVLNTVATQYNGNVDPSTLLADNVVPVQITTTLPGGQTSKVVNTYDQGNTVNTYGGTAPVVFGNVIQKDEYDFSGTLARSTVNHYLWQDNATYKADNVLNLLASTTVNDGGGHQLAQTTYAYDQYGTTGKPTPSGIVTASLVAPPAGEPYRGNLTTVSHWLNTTNSFLSSTATYFDTGMKASSTPPQAADGLNRTTTYSYSSTFLGAYLTQTNMPDTLMPDSGATVVPHIISGDYDFNTGLLITFTDENGQIFTYKYDDMLRLTTGNHPDGGQTLFTYPDPLTVDRQRLISGTTYEHDQFGFDGLGRPVQTRQFTPDCSTYIKVDTAYDNVGRTRTVSNPYCLTTEATYGVTTMDYDALSRVIKTTKQDQSFSTTKYDDTPGDPSGAPVTGAPLVCATVTDESGRNRQSCSDAFGRLIKVLEPNPGAAATNATGSVTVSGNEQSANSQPATPGQGTVTIHATDPSGGDQKDCIVFDTCTYASQYTYDTGTVSITVNGVQKSVSYGRFDTAATIAWGLSCAFHNDTTSPVDAPCPSSAGTSTTVNLTARTTGASTNYPLSATSSTSDPIDFTVSFTTSTSGSALTGGQNASSTPDTGSVTVTINGTDYSTPFGSNDTAATIASNLAMAISAGAYANAAPSGGLINLTSKTPGTAGEFSLSASYTWNSSQFTSPSFTTSTSGSSLSKAKDASAINNNPFITNYQYDPLGNMLCVHQKGADATADKACTDSTVPASWRPRTFTYDSLSRLLTASNPENNNAGIGAAAQITYSYDNDGNLTSKTEPAPNQLWGTASPQTVTVNYSYDALDRLLDTTYPGSTTQNSSHRYDYGSFWGVTLQNPIGREVAATAANGTIGVLTSYDPMGRVAQTTQCNPGVTGCKVFTAGYDKLGDVTSLVYPANNFTLTYSYDGAARLYDATDSNGVTYGHLDPTSANSFWPTGTMKEFVSPNFNNNKFHVDLNNRLQPVEIWAGTAQGTSALFDKQYAYNPSGQTQVNNGNIYTITNIKDSTRTQTFTYDALNRLASATDNVHWGNTYSYDAWGNLQKAPMGNLLGENFPHPGDTNNHISTYSYDAAGNLLNDGVNSFTYVYDAENRITSVGSTTYVYGADGRRVQKSDGTNYWYGPGGAALAETDANGAWTFYIFFAGERLARNVPQAPPNAADIKYYITDHLHSTAMFMDQSGSLLDDNDFYPWGGVVPGVGQTTSNNTIKFTGKYRDTESQLDYFGARYYANITGRFMSPDWAAKPVTVPYAKFGDPQSLNLYSYVENAPINRIDADGHTLSGWTSTGDPWMPTGGGGSTDAAMDSASGPQDPMYDVTTTYKNTYVNGTLVSSIPISQTIQQVGSSAFLYSGKPIMTIQQASAIVVITHGSYAGITVADHAGLVIMTHNDQVIYDPGGAYQGDVLPQSGTGGVVTHSDDGATFGNYLEYERKGESYVATYKVDISAADAAKIITRLDGNADNTPFKCARDVSTVLQGIGPFQNLPVSKTPGSLEDSVSQISTDTAWFKGKN